MRLSSRFVWTILATIAGASAFGQIVTLRIDSDPGDGIGQGEHRTIVYEPHWGTSWFQVWSWGLDGSPTTNYLLFDINQSIDDPNNDQFGLQLSTTQLGHGLQVGEYKDVQRAAFAQPGHGGLDFSFHNNGCDTLSGSFTINSIDLEDDGTGLSIVSAIDVSFVQYGDGQAGACHGHLTYSSTAPEPGTYAALGLGLGVLACLRTKKRSSAKRR